MSEVWFPVEHGTYNWTSPYGYRKDPLGRTSGQSFHGGVDIAPKEPGRHLPLGSIVTARITVPAFEQGGAGANIWMTDADGILWKIFHLHRIDVVTGQWVNHCDPVGLMGTTGASTGVHGHVERWERGVRTDPTPFLRAAEAAGRFPGSVPLPPLQTITTEAQAMALSHFIGYDPRTGMAWEICGLHRKYIPSDQVLGILRDHLGLEVRDVAGEIIDARVELR